MVHFPGWCISGWKRVTLSARTWVSHDTSGRSITLLEVYSLGGKAWFLPSHTWSVGTKSQLRQDGMFQALILFCLSRLRRRGPTLCPFLYTGNTMAALALQRFSTRRVLLDNCLTVEQWSFAWSISFSMSVVRCVSPSRYYRSRNQIAHPLCLQECALLTRSKLSVLSLNVHRVRDVWSLRWMSQDVPTCSSIRHIHVLPKSRLGFRSELNWFGWQTLLPCTFNGSKDLGP